ncbi:DUF58 domain-containing protein [Euzebya sp.]|uniref:DUF58 domain-containing protein n=1 Tax=Euzebya sp. TaxID=1971409 RepID=UPI003516B4AF
MSQPATTPAGRAPRLDAFGRLELAIQRRLEGRLHGDHLGLLPGHGSELGEARRYRPGDDVRRIDWAVTARTTATHVRDTIADHELTTIGVLDLSGSIHFGTGRRIKRDVAIEVLGGLGFVTAHGVNRFGALALHPAGERWYPPASGRHHVHATLRRIARLPRANAATAGEGSAEVDLARGLARAGRLARRRGFVVVISDFMGTPAWSRRLRALVERHDVMAVEVVDPRELTLPDVGYLTVADPETGRRRVVDTGDARLRERYARAAAAQRAAVAADIRRAGADHLQVRTDADWLADLLRHIEVRRRSRMTRSARR